MTRSSFKSVAIACAFCLFVTGVYADGTQLGGIFSQFADAPQQQVQPNGNGIAQPKTAELFGLIQETVAPDCWVPSTTVVAATGGPSPAALQLVNIMHENVQPPAWDINGGQGTITIVPW